MSPAGTQQEDHTEKEMFDWEMRHFFEGGWVFLGHGQELQAPGDQKAFTVGKESILVLRDKGEHLNGFFNTCRHRGHELLEPRGTRKLGAVRCPYHAWVYGLDGTLRAAPQFGEVEGFDRSDYSLVPVGLRQWEGALFVNASGNAPALEDRLADLGALIAPASMEGMSLDNAGSFEVDGNWKTVTMDLLQATHPDRMDTSGREPGETAHYGVFPSLLLGLHPDYVATYRIEPLEPGRTRVERRRLVSTERG